MASPTTERWGPFGELVRHAPPEALAETFALVDARVLALHPGLGAPLQRLSGRLVLRAGEQVKTLRMAERVLTAMAFLSRKATLVSIGGGTLGDLATVVAHLHKRGCRLIHVPTTLLAAVDSSVGGKGAVNLGSFKNAAGVFQNASEAWICEELFATLPGPLIREGKVEALKMAAALEAPLWRALLRDPPLADWIREGRKVKTAVCRRDPFETRGLRERLNFGHTFGHALEGLSRFRLRHGAAVRLGVICALDVGRALGVTPGPVAESVEAGFQALGGPPLRGVLAARLRRVQPAELDTFLRADKKASQAEGLRMVLLTALGQARTAAVPSEVWRALLPHWGSGQTP